MRWIIGSINIYHLVVTSSATDLEWGLKSTFDTRVQMASCSHIPVWLIYSGAFCFGKQMGVWALPLHVWLLLVLKMLYISFWKKPILENSAIGERFDWKLLKCRPYALGSVRTQLKWKLQTSMSSWVIFSLLLRALFNCPKIFHWYR